MLKRTLLASLLVAGVAAPTLVEAAPRGTAKLSVNGKAVTIDYGQPSLAGRDMLAKAPDGFEWRLGADSPTSLKSEADLDFGGKTVAKGSYVLKARHDAGDKWSLLLSQDDTKVAEVPLAFTAAKASVEVLDIKLHATKGGGDIVIAWGTNTLSASFAVK